MPDHFYLFQATNGIWCLMVNGVSLRGASEIKFRVRDGEPARLIVEYHLLHGEAQGDGELKEHGRANEKKGRAE